MPTNAGSVGVDYSIQWYVNGALQDLGDVQNVTFATQKHVLKNMPYNAPPKYAFIPDGHTVKFSITRTDSRWDDWMAQFEANYNRGASNLNFAGTLHKSVTNPDGSVSRYLYRGFVFFIDGLGDVSREKSIMVGGEGYASDMVKIA